MHAHSCPTLCDPGSCSLPGSSVHGFSRQEYWKESEVAQSCPTLCDPMDCSLPGSSVDGIFRARILEWVAISFSRRSSWPRDWTQVSCIVGRCFTIWATREVDCYFLLQGSSWPRDWTHVSCVSCIGWWILYHYATWEALPRQMDNHNKFIMLSSRLKNLGGKKHFLGHCTVFSFCHILHQPTSKACWPCFQYAQNLPPFQHSTFAKPTYNVQRETHKLTSKYFKVINKINKPLNLSFLSWAIHLPNDMEGQSS